MPTLYIVDYEQYVEEGDNYAGFAGYRERQKVLMSRPDYMDWMLEAARDFNVGNKKLLRVRVAEYQHPNDLDVKEAVAEATNRLKDMEKIEAKAALLREKERLEKRLKELDSPSPPPTFSCSGWTAKPVPQPKV